MKKILVVFAVAMFLFASISTSAFASWHIANLHLVGGTPSQVLFFILSEDGTFPKSWYTVGGQKSDQVLASILTAVALGKKLYVQLANPQIEFSELGGAYLIN